MSFGVRAGLDRANSSPVWPRTQHFYPLRRDHLPLGVLLVASFLSSVLLISPGASAPTLGPLVTLPSAASAQIVVAAVSVFYEPRLISTGSL